MAIRGFTMSSQRILRKLQRNLAIALLLHRCLLLPSSSSSSYTLHIIPSTSTLYSTSLKISSRDLTLQFIPLHRITMNPDRPNRSNPGPPPTNPIQTGALIAVSLLAAVSFAVYESPEVRHFAENLRRQIAVKLRQLGDHVDPAQRQRMREDPFSGQPLFNRPEDAEGVRQQARQDGVEADEESQRRQQEEIEYWNKLAEQQRKAARTAAKGKGKEEAGPSGTGERSSSFEDFSQKDAEGGYVYNTGAEMNQTEGLTHRQGRGMDRSNPFSDENGIELESTASSWAGAGKVTVDLANSLISPRKDELMSESDSMSEGIYAASDNRLPASHQPTIEQSMEWKKTIHEPVVATADPLIDLSEPFNPTDAVKKEEDDQEQYATSAHITRPVNDDAFAAIHAWNESASSLPLDQSTSSGTARDFYSPLPTTSKIMSETSDGDFGSAADFAPSAGMEVENIQDDSEDGVATPTESMSIIGDQESLGGSEDGRHTPGSWTEVGSSVSGEEIRQRL